MNVPALYWTCGKGTYALGVVKALCASAKWSGRLRQETNPA
jgi:hypothetical protein